MFPSRYFTTRYFTTRYFTASGADQTAAVVSVSATVKLTRNLALGNLYATDGITATLKAANAITASLEVPE